MESHEDMAVFALKLLNKRSRLSAISTEWSLKAVKLLCIWIERSNLVNEAMSLEICQFEMLTSKDYFYVFTRTHF